jgi:hypothetical protein
LRTTTAILTTALVLSITTGPAAADPADTIGVSWSGRATSGACTAGVDGPAAALYNPALIGGSGAGFFVGALFLHNSLDPKIGGSDTLQAFAEMGASIPLADFGDGGDLWLGITALTPVDSLYDINLTDDEHPSFLVFGTRERRLSLSAAIAWNIWGLFGIGAGFQLLPTVSGAVQADLADPLGKNELNVDVGYRLSPTAGLLFHVHPDIRIGLNYRGENRTRIDLPVDVQAEGLEISASVAAQTYYVPHRLSMGIEALLPLGLAAEVDLGWLHYADFPRPAPTVAVFDDTGSDSLGGTTDPLDLVDVFSPSASLKFAGPFDAALGYRFVPAATKSQSGRYNVLDNNRHQISCGGRVAIPGITGIGISALYVTADFSATLLQPRRDEKKLLIFGNPGYPSIQYSGFRISSGLGLEVSY